MTAEWVDILWWGIIGGSGVAGVLVLVYLCARQWTRGKLAEMDGYMKTKRWKTEE